MPVLGVVPENVPPFTEEPDVDVCCPPRSRARSELPRKAYTGPPVVNALEPAAAEAEDENDVVAPAPVAPEDPLAWM